MLRFGFAAAATVVFERIICAMSDMSIEVTGGCNGTGAGSWCCEC